MTKQQIKDWNGMLSFIISFHQNKESIVYPLLQKQDAELPSKITISILITQITFNTSYRFEAVNCVNTSYKFEAVNGVNSKPVEAVNGINTSYMF
jgi:hypothetical protein